MERNLRSLEKSELRQDPVSRDWVIIATGRSQRPHEFRSAGGFRVETPLEMCPFENPEVHGNEVVGVYSGDGGWAVKVVRNKFPIVGGELCEDEVRRGPYLVKEAGGYHEVVIFGDHKKSIAELPLAAVKTVVETYRARYLDLKRKECADYILINHNHGRGAGASISHPHSQILAISFIPADIRRSLDGSRRYHAERGRCVHCDVLAWELKEGKRVVFENESMVAVVPFAPKFSYEVRIFPRSHLARFEETGDKELADFAEALRVSLAKIHHGLDDAPYNFFIHTAPSGSESDYDFYHWHLEISPRVNVWGGFELGTGGDVIDVDPDEAAKYLREIKI